MTFYFFPDNVSRKSFDLRQGIIANFVMLCTHHYLFLFPAGRQRNFDIVHRIYNTAFSPLDSRSLQYALGQIPAWNVFLIFLFKVSH